MKKLPLIAVIALATLGGGCSWFHSGTRNPQWHSAQQERPLEVPPDLEKPVNAAALSIPDLPANASTSASANVSATEPEAAPPGTQATVAAGVAQAVGTGSLVFNDTVDSVYGRVGIALKRGDIGKLVAEDAAAHSYQVEVTTTQVEKPKGFFARIFSSAKKREVNATVAVSVVADGDKARVDLSGPEAAVRQLQAALQQRLG